MNDLSVAPVPAVKTCTCPVCEDAAAAFDVVDFNKSCEEIRGKFLPLSGIPIYYYRCLGCGFTFAPEICAWSLEQFEEHIYNDRYVDIDPDYVSARPTANAGGLLPMFALQNTDVRHLDYGGGDGLLSRLLCEAGWKSTSYDPFVNADVKLEDLGKFGLITAFEVFEHVPDVQALMKNLCSLLEDDGIVLFSTMVTDGEIVRNERIKWWYASPRNGHISLFSKYSLGKLAAQHDINFGSFSSGVHTFWKSSVPDWAKHIYTFPDAGAESAA